MGSKVPDNVESNVPDVVHSKTDSKGSSSQGKKVSIKDVLDHKDGGEVWVVIKGEVYKCVPFPPSSQNQEGADEKV